jgi:hypothetical protein
MQVEEPDKKNESDSYPRMKYNHWKRNGADLKQPLYKQQKKYVAKKVEGKGIRKHSGGQTIKKAVEKIMH